MPTTNRRQQVEQMSDAELNAEVAEKVMGWDRHKRNTAFYVPKTERNWVGAQPTCLVSEWHPTTSGSTMLEVMEAMRERGYAITIARSTVEGDNYRCMLSSWKSDLSEAHNPSLPRAVAEAALLAVEGEDA